MGVSGGDTVQVHYTGRLEDGTVFDSSKDREPLEFTMDSGQIIPGFEEAVKGMEVDEEKTVTIAAKDAYGEHEDSRVQEYSRESLPDNFEPEKGQVLAVRDQQGQELPVTVVDFNDKSVTVDLNHPLAGHELTFDIQVIGIK